MLTGVDSAAAGLRRLVAPLATAGKSVISGTAGGSAIFATALEAVVAVAVEIVTGIGAAESVGKADGAATVGAVGVIPLSLVAGAGGLSFAAADTAPFAGSTIRTTLGSGRG